ncbi:tRNA adenosine(34) deaminase TadA [Buchnera aphidicola (Hyperomyzus lactucae)]|uniref:tRNA-specific adenosine deaminase n=1 Tax=Buchnera aphidicola (Hyperomyzus lactucae) TaxID=1241860 RepID=A0A4D6XYC0_9GAMM|nr:tRNA adenosine(34) deaminase TadA [Buchnera aphidicola]QCI20979.1 tRNA adenosine(34) deaminase TadA [Buchnera aphidicola (Hyperomyzus lactucae)]
MKKDIKWMKLALKYAYYAKKKGEIPIGAVLIFEERILGIGWNNSISQNDPTAHAEIIALRNAAKKIKNYRLLNTTLYVTLEPCIMCCGAIIHSRIKRLVFGTPCKTFSDRCSLKHIFSNSEKDYKLNIEKNIMQKECASILVNFFQKKRQEKYISLNNLN